MAEAAGNNPRDVFVVFGRNEVLRRSMFDFLRSINLSPMEWDRAVEFTEHGSPYIGDVLDAAFERAQAIVVLLTPDEVAYLRPELGNGPDDPETSPSAQVRPNVLFEAGMALGRNPKRTILVEVGDVRSFSDIVGRHVVRLDNSVAKRQTLANRLNTAGCDVDVSGADWHTSGDFTAPPAPGGGLPLGRRVPSTPSSRRALDFDVKYFDKGSGRVGKLQVINRGTETALHVQLSVPDDAPLDLSHATLPISRIPGGGKSVTIDVLSSLHMFGGGPERTSAFDVTVTATTESGDSLTQNVFIDLNG